MFKFKLRPLAAVLHNRRWSLALAGAVVPGLALAAPGGGVVVGGQASIGGTGGNVVVNQTSNAAIINWQQFSVGSNEYVLFNQPSASAAVLNRVVGGNASEILGNISANGRVFLINPNGVMFGQGAKVDVGGLVASTLNISDSDFMQGRYALAGSPSGTAGVSNAGRITAADGGFVVLAGSRVDNSGLIQARLGTVALASGSAVTLGLDAQGLVDFSVDAAALSAAAGVDNLGGLVADGGSVILSAQTARELIGNAVNNRGSVQARSIGEHEGSVYLLAEGGDILQDGLIDASGAGGADAGKVRIEGDGDILLSGNSRIVATGDSGGDVRAIATGTLTYAQGSSLDVSRKSTAGAGGFAELSGHEHLRVEDLVNVGSKGHLLFDPDAITIGAGEGAMMTEQALESQLRFMGAGSVFTLSANQSITFSKFSDGVLDGTNPQQAGYGGGLQLLVTGSDPTNFIKFDDVADTIKVKGEIRVDAEYGGTVRLGKLISDGDVTIGANGLIEVAGITAGGSIDIGSETGGVTVLPLTQNGSTTRGKLSSGSSLDIDAEGNITLGDVEVRNGSLRLDSEGGRIDTGKLSLTLLTSELNSEGTPQVYEGIALNAFDGIKTGDISLTMTADVDFGSPTVLNGYIFINANASPTSNDTTPSNLETGKINVTIGPATGIETGLVASADVFLTNGTTAEGEGSPTADASGGDIKTGSITIKARGSTEAEFCYGEYCYTEDAASSHLILAAKGKIDLQGNKVTVESASADGSDSSLAQFISYFDSVALGDIAMAGAATSLSAVAAPLLNPTDLQPRAATQIPADVTVGYLDGVDDLYLYASRDVTVNAGTRAVRLDTTSGISAGGQIKLKGSDIELAGSLEASRLVIEATGEVSTAAVEGTTYIDVGGISIDARFIDLEEADIYVGSESMDLGKDANLLSKTPENLRPGTAGPNAAFVARDGVRLGYLSLGGGYLFVKAPSVSAVSVGSEGRIFYNFRPFDDAASFEIPASSGLLSGSQVTYALGGTGYRGDITVVDVQNTASGLVDKELSDTNYLFLTQGRVNGKDALSNYTSGQVLVLEGDSGPQEPPPEQQQEQAVVAQTAVSQIELVETEGVGEIEVADASEVEEVTDSPDETLECR